MAPVFNSVTLLGFIDKLVVAGLVVCCSLILKKEAALRLLTVLAALVTAEFCSKFLGLTATASFFHLPANRAFSS